MKLTRDEWQALEKATLKERIERLEEYVDYSQQREEQRSLDEFNKEMNDISEKSYKQQLAITCVAMILVWITIWVLITKLCL